MALVFYASPEAPVRCAAALSRALKDHPALRVRMGHSQWAGQRSGRCYGSHKSRRCRFKYGAPCDGLRRRGHILLSKHVAEDLSEFEEWRPLLHDLGTCDVKHGMQVAIVNLLPAALLRLDPMSIRSEMICASRNSPRRRSKVNKVVWTETNIIELQCL
jgi:hypothetical protein